MGGGIAYLADMVGKKLGKKRLSLFGLRPRQTAALGTICLGVLITIFTISIALVVSSGMRQALLHGLEVRKELNQLEEQQKAFASKNGELTKRNDDLTSKIGATSKELAARLKELTNAQGKLRALNTQIGSLQSQIGVLTSDALRKKAALATANNRLVAINHNLDEVNKALTLNRKQYAYVSGINKEVLHQNADLVEANDKLKAAQVQLVAERTKLEQDLAKIKQSVADLQSDEDIAQEKLKKSQGKLADVENELTKAQQELGHTKVELAETQENLDHLKGIFDVSRKQALIYKIDEEVARLKVPAGVSQNAANGAVTLLLRRARVAAQQRGATKASVFDHDALSSDEIVRKALKDLTGAPTGRVVIASSSINAFRGEPVSLELSVLPDPLVYLSGQMVAETVIDASRGDAAIYQQLTNFLQEKVSQKVKKDGMIPVANSDVSFGQITQADVLQIIEQLHAANRPIRLQAHAVGDTYAADPLKLEFRLR